jgi:hypothetical protein
VSNASYSDSTEVAISSIDITEEAISIQYMTPGDVRDKGKVVQAHQITIDRRHKQYRDGMETLVEAAEDLLRDVIGDWPHKEPYVPSGPDDDE